MTRSIPHIGVGESLQSVLDSWQKDSSIDLIGVQGGILSYLLIDLQRSRQLPMVVLEKDAKSATSTAANLAFHLRDEADSVLLFPAYEMGVYDEVVPDKSSSLRRSALLFRLTQPKPWKFLVIPQEALMRRVVPKDSFLQAVMEIQIGTHVNRDHLVSVLERGGYHHTPMVEEPGTYSIRGALIDLFVPYMDVPVRLDFFGDEVETIVTFDASTQARLSPVQEIWIHPAKQALLPLNSSEMSHLERRLRVVCDGVNYPTAQTAFLIDDILEGRLFVGVHGFLPALFSHLDSLFNYLGDADYCVIHPEMLNMLFNKVDTSSQSDFERKKSSNLPAFAPPSFLCSKDEMMNHMESGAMVRIHPFELTQIDDEGAKSNNFMDLQSQGFETLNAQLMLDAHTSGALDVLDSFCAKLHGLVENGYATMLVAHSQGQANRLMEMLAHRDIEVKQWDGGELPLSGVGLIQGELVNGFLWPAQGICFISEEEIFGKSSVRKKSKSIAKEVFFDLKSLHVGDLVVHKEHGVGRYGGLVHQSVRNVGMDFILITYKGDDKLYLPIYRLSQVQKYKSGTDNKVGLDKLGGTTFAKTKAAARKRAMELAAKLLDIYARKELTLRDSVDEKDDLYIAFEAAFPFEETQDQLAVIQEVMNDMESNRPMDRLVCGDVGFGKTEVALRSAFRAVNSGRQVAILVPTTVLAQQHYINVKKRFASYPVRVEMLSRFRKKGQNANTVLGIIDGTVDIVVGTHRLLSNDVHFKNLGLLVVDEEHRFGVAHKERIRSLRTSVDTLAMTATPIPRTLHMAFSKLRDLSIIGTAPVNRLPIKTMVCHDDAAMIKDAIERELARDGQVYFVHNRVKDITRVAARISHLVPEARIAIGHGQMKEDKLETVMNDFISGHCDVLVSTAIIESGLDIPRANTIIIDRADTFGLAQLYQIRGRVGRSDVQAYAYLIVPPLSLLSDEGKERIDTLVRHTELGSGFHVATMDLEIRGAGNILGTEQSGDVDGVGFEMYMELLEEATSRLNGESVAAEFEPEINLEAPGFFPEQYIGDVGLRLHFYKELAVARTESEVGETAASLVDRFGTLPVEASTLIDGMIAKVIARQIGVLGVETSAKKITLHLGSQAKISPQTVMDIVRKGDGTIRLTRDFKIIQVITDSSTKVTQEAIRLLRDLSIDFG